MRSRSSVRLSAASLPTSCRKSSTISPGFGGFPSARRSASARSDAAIPSSLLAGQPDGSPMTPYNGQLAMLSSLACASARCSGPCLPRYSLDHPVSATMRRPICGSSSSSPTYATGQPLLAAAIPIWTANVVFPAPVPPTRTCMPGHNPPPMIPAYSGHGTGTGCSSPFRRASARSSPSRAMSAIGFNTSSGLPTTSESTNGSVSSGKSPSTLRWFSSRVLLMVSASCGGPCIGSPGLR